MKIRKRTRPTRSRFRSKKRRQEMDSLISAIHDPRNAHLFTIEHVSSLFKKVP